MLKLETWETGSGTDTAAVITKALKHSERYVQSIGVKRVPIEGKRSKRPEQDRYVINIKYGHPHGASERTS